MKVAKLLSSKNCISLKKLASKSETTTKTFTRVEDGGHCIFDAKHRGLTKIEMV